MASESIAAAEAPKFARSLSPYERLFLAIDQVNGFNFCVAFSFRGTVDHARWRSALDAVQRRHPLLNAALNLDDPNAPFFVSVKAAPVPLRFLPRHSASAWQREMEAEMAQPFDLQTAPWLRATVLEDTIGCDLILTVNHMILDGIGLVGVAREILATLAGHVLPAMPLPPSSEEQLAARKAETGTKGGRDPLPPPEINSRAFVSRNERYSAPSITALRLSPAESTRLLAVCRRSETTLGSLLMAVLLRSLRELSPALAAEELYAIIPIDARPYLGNSADVVLSISGARTKSVPLETSLCDTAKALRKKLAPYQSLVEIEAYFDRIAAAMALGLDPHTLMAVMGQQAGHDLLLSNLKQAEFPHVPRELEVEAVWGPSVLAGFVGEHAVGVATFGRAFHLVYTSHTPIPGMLEKVNESLAACMQGNA